MEIKQIVRDSNGLISGLTYAQDAEGMIDWRKMIKPEFLVPNRQAFERQNKEIPATIEGLEDKDLLILLGGIKNLARLRGFSKVNYTVTSPSPEYVIAVCQIEWLPNFETEGRVVISGGIGDSCPQNTNGIGRAYLGPIAENRAFVRCVRNFLNVNIVGQDEVAPPKSQEEAATAPPATSSASLLEKLMVEKGVTFDKLKEKLVAEAFEGAANFNSVADIPKIKVFELIERLRRKKA